MSARHDEKPGKGKRSRGHVGQGPNFKPELKGRDGVRPAYIVDSVTGCWLSTGATNQWGYPMINSQPGARVYYEACYNLEIPEGFQAHHFIPGCPKNCCNPEHLVIVPEFDHWKLERQLRAWKRLAAERGINMDELRLS